MCQAAACSHRRGNRHRRPRRPFTLLFALFLTFLSGAGFAAGEMSAGVTQTMQPKPPPGPPPRTQPATSLRPARPPKAPPRAAETINETPPAPVHNFVLFYTDGCPHCRQFLPKFQTISSELMSDTAAFRALNVDDSDEARQGAQKLGVTKYPTVLVLQDDTIVGAIPRAYLQLSRRRLQSIIKGVLGGDGSMLTPWAAQKFPAAQVATNGAFPVSVMFERTLSFYKREVNVLFRIGGWMLVYGVGLLLILSPVVLAVLAPACCCLRPTGASDLDCRSHGYDSFLSTRACHVACMRKTKLWWATCCPRRCGKRLRGNSYAYVERSAQKLEAKVAEGKRGVLSRSWLRAKSEVYRGLEARKLGGIVNVDGNFVLDLPRQPSCIEEVSIPLRTRQLTRVQTPPASKDGSADSFATAPMLRPDFTQSLPALVNHVYLDVLRAVKTANEKATESLCEDDTTSTESSNTADAIRISVFDPRNLRVPLMSVTRAPNGKGGSSGGRSANSSMNDWPKKRLRRILKQGRHADATSAPRPHVFLRGVYLEFAGLHLTSGGEVWILWHPVKSHVKEPTSPRKRRVTPVHSSPRHSQFARVSPTKRTGESAPAEDESSRNIIVQPNDKPPFVPTAALDSLKRSIWRNHYSDFAPAPPLELYTPIMQLWVTSATAAFNSPLRTPRATMAKKLAQEKLARGMVRRSTFRRDEQETQRELSVSPTAASTGGWRAKRRHDIVVRCLEHEVAPMLRKLSQELRKRYGRLYLPLLDQSIPQYDDDNFDDPDAPEVVSINIFDPVFSVQVRA